MGESLDSGDAALSARLQAVSAEIATFRPREPHHHPTLLGGEAGIPYERILLGVARGREAIDLAIGEGLCALEDRDALMSLGYSRMTDYAREVLGLPETTARSKAKLARGLADRPLLREAVRSGDLAPRKALEVLPVARGDAERPWLLLAGTLSVRELGKAVARALGGPVEGTAPAAEPPDDERWQRLALPLRPEHRVVVEEAMRLAGEILGRGAPAWQRLEAMAQEFLGSHAVEPREEDLGTRPRPEDGIPPEELGRALEIESNGWAWLEAVEPVAAPELREMEPEALDARLRELVEKRTSWDELFGGLARGFVRAGLSRSLGFANLGQYVRERLGMSRRAVEQRVWLERRMEDLPQLRHALACGDVSYEKARVVAGVADFATVNEWIRRAGDLTCVELEAAVEAARDAQACARRRLEVRVPERIAGLLDEALRAVADAWGGPIDPAGCLALLARHFVQVWGPILERRNDARARVMERDGGRCTTPGCSRGSAQSHHVVRRSQGGSDDPGNLTPVCAPHHLRGIHGGLIRVSGTAPDGLVWELRSGVRLGPARRLHPAEARRLPPCSSASRGSAAGTTRWPTSATPRRDGGPGPSPSAA
jgi:hypothetical protein